MKNMFMLMIVVLMTQGCTYKYGDFAIMSTKKVDFNKSYTKGSTKVSGEDKSKIYIIIPNKLHPMLDQALENALDNSCAEYLTDANVTLTAWYIPYIYGETTFKVEGYPWYEEGKDENSCKHESK